MLDDARPNVHSLDAILMWPLSLQAQGALFAAREDNTRPPAAWLRAYAEAIQNGKESRWKLVDEPYGSLFGVPTLCSDPAAQAYAEFVYFHPFIDKLLYETRPSRRSMEVLARDDVRGVAFTLSTGDTLRLRVTRLQLFLFTTDLAVVCVQVSGDEELGADGARFEQALHILNELRRVYPPFFPKDENGQAAPWFGEAPRMVQWLGEDGNSLGTAGDYQDAGMYMDTVRTERRPPLAGHWQWLIHPLLPWKPVGEGECGARTDCEVRRMRVAGLCYEQLGDERAYTMARVVVRDPHTLGEAQFFRLANLDKGAEGWAYQPEFQREQAGRVCYDRFWHWGTRYMVNGFGFVQLCGKGSPEFLRSHFQGHYFLLNLLAVLQKNSLLLFWDRLSNLLREYAATSSSRDEFHKDQKWLSEDFANYLALFDFSEVSNQQQALELFTMLRRQMRIEVLTKEVLDQLAYARSIERANFEERQNEASGRLAVEQTKLSQIATDWLPAAIALSFLGISFGWKVLDDWFLTPKEGIVYERWRAALYSLLWAVGVFGVIRGVVRWRIKKSVAAEDATRKQG